MVDLQYDFMSGGALAVPRGDEVVAVANRMQPRFQWVLATQDWHPPGHASFASSHPGHRVGDVIEVDGRRQELWPDHCVQGTRGAELVQGLDCSRVRRVFRKGVDPAVDSYSAFFDNDHRRSTGLSEYLRANGIDEVYLLGLATDYCVLYSGRDARQLALRTHVIVDGCRAIDLHPGDGERALASLSTLGATLIRSDEVSFEAPSTQPASP